MMIVKKLSKRMDFQGRGKYFEHGGHESEGTNETCDVQGVNEASGSTTSSVTTLAETMENQEEEEVVDDDNDVDDDEDEEEEEEPQSTVRHALNFFMHSEADPMTWWQKSFVQIKNQPNQSNKEAEEEAENPNHIFLINYETLSSSSNSEIDEDKEESACIPEHKPESEYKRSTLYFSASEDNDEEEENDSNPGKFKSDSEESNSEESETKEDPAEWETQFLILEEDIEDASSAETSIKSEAPDEEEKPETDINSSDNRPKRTLNLFETLSLIHQRLKNENPAPSVEEASDTTFSSSTFIQFNNHDSSEEGTSTKSFIELNRNTEDEETPSSEQKRLFKKNQRKISQNNLAHKRRAGILITPPKKEPSSLLDETENIRRSIIDEIDRELENMGEDGVKEGFFLSFEGDYEPGSDQNQDQGDRQFQGRHLSKYFEDDVTFLDPEEDVVCDDIEPHHSKSAASSARDSIYSATSMEIEDEAEEELRTAPPDIDPSQRETIFDKKGVVRIERVMATPEEFFEPSLLEEVPFEFKKQKIYYILEEIMETERKYVEDMGKVLSEYKVFLNERCPEQVDVVFGNMDQIYKMQLKFLRRLEVSNMEVQEIAEAFIDFVLFLKEDLLRLYPTYFSNSPKANAALRELSHILQEKQNELNDKMNLSAYLITPLQRLGKYILFLENILKELKKENKPIGSVQIALGIARTYMTKGNDAVAIASILQSPLHIKDYGSYLMSDEFQLLKPKKMEVVVFLFEEVTVFTTRSQKNSEQFVYYQSIRTNDLRIATFDDTTIHLIDFMKKENSHSRKHTYVLDVRNPELKITWQQKIEDILWKQMETIKEMTLKRYQSGQGKDPRRKSRAERQKTIGFSTFYDLV